MMLAREERGVFRHLCKGIVPHRNDAIREIRGCLQLHSKGNRYVAYTGKGASSFPGVYRFGNWGKSETYSFMSPGKLLQPIFTWETAEKQMVRVHQIAVNRSKKMRMEIAHTNSFVI